MHLLGQEERDEGDDEGDGDVEDERGRVVDQALALEDGDDPPGQAEPLAETDRGDGVGGATTAPTVKASASGTAGSAAWTTRPAAAAESATRTTASEVMTRRLRRKSTKGIWRAAA